MRYDMYGKNLRFMLFIFLIFMFPSVSSLSVFYICMRLELISLHSLD